MWFQAAHTNFNLETGKLVVFFRWAKCILSEWWKTISAWYLISLLYWWQNARLNQPEPSCHHSIWGNHFVKGPRHSLVSQTALRGQRRFIYFVDEMIWPTPRVYLIFCLVSLPTIWTNFAIPLSKTQSIPSQPALTAQAWVRSQQLRFQSDLDNLLTPWSPFSYLWDSFACPATFKKMLRKFYDVSGSIWAPSKNDNCWGPLLGWLPSPDHTPLRTASPTSSPGPQQLAHWTFCWAPGQS